MPEPLLPYFAWAIMYISIHGGTITSHFKIGNFVCNYSIPNQFIAGHSNSSFQDSKCEKYDEVILFQPIKCAVISIFHKKKPKSENFTIFAKFSKCPLHNYIKSH